MEYTFTLKCQLAEVTATRMLWSSAWAKPAATMPWSALGSRGAWHWSSPAKRPMRMRPSARLIEVTPGLVGLTDVATIVGVSRQNMRKLMLAYPGRFPAPVHEGSASIGSWRTCWFGCRARATIRWPSIFWTWHGWLCSQRGEGRAAIATLGFQ